MWIESITIQGFGCLINSHYRFPKDRLALIIDENERGKSTLVAAIIAALCGFPAKYGRAGIMKPLDAFRPWGGETYAVELELEAGGSRYVVQRDFNKKNPFLVLDSRTNQDVSAQFPTDLAHHFLGLPREDYERIAVISGKDVGQFSSSSTIRTRLIAMVEGSKDSQSAEIAIESLKNAVYKLDSRTIQPETAISRINRGISEKLDEISKLDEALESSSKDVKILEDLKVQKEHQLKLLTDLDREYARSRLAEVRRKLEDARRDAEQCKTLRQELKELEPYADFPADREEELSSAVTSLKEIRNQIQEREAENQRLTVEAQALRARINEREHFTRLGRDRLMQLYGLINGIKDSLPHAQTTLDSARRRQIHDSSQANRFLRKAVALLTVATLLFLASIATLAQDSAVKYLGVATLLAGVVAGTAGARLWLRGREMRDAASEALKEAEDVFEQNKLAAIQYLRELGVYVSAQSDLIELLDETCSEIKNYLADEDQLAQLSNQIESNRRSIEEIRKREKENDDIIRSILKSAGLDSVDSIEQALLAFKERCKKRDRYWQITNSELPSLENRLLSDAELSKLKAEADELSALVGQDTAAGDEQSPFDVDRKRQEVQQKLREIEEQISNLEREVGLVVEQYRRRYPVVQEELKALRQELQRATRFNNAIQRAKEVLEEVASDIRRRWADALNRRASSILPRLNPDYTDLRFDDSLNLTIRRSGDGRILDKLVIDSCLSTGAKDQIYLSARLACCLELSAAGESMPIVLDDALMAFDDERFENAFRFIAEELARNQQIIALTCHRGRHERLANQDWFKDHVQVMEIRKT